MTTVIMKTCIKNRSSISLSPYAEAHANPFKMYSKNMKYAFVLSQEDLEIGSSLDKTVLTDTNTVTSSTAPNNFLSP